MSEPQLPDYGSLGLLLGCTLQTLISVTEIIKFCQNVVKFVLSMKLMHPEFVK